MKMKIFDKTEKKIWDNIIPSENPISIDTDSSWIYLEQQMNIGSAIGSIKIKDSRQSIFSKFNWNFQFPTAIAFSMFVIISVSIFYKSLNTTITQTENGTVSTVELSDGSIIKLNSTSKLSYRSNFNETSRTVSLFGEAFFNIVHNQKPFIVEVDGGKVKVLGTKFNVQCRANQFEVGVTEGKVLVTKDDKSIILTEGQRFVTDPSQGFNPETRAAYKNYPDWVHDKLYCEKKSLRKVCNEIERKFNITIKFANSSTGEKTITGLLDASNLKSVLSSISLLSQHEFKFDGDTYTIL
tara:strand:+ start:43965 stop:44852 length:888 start_codon:yes stop_codon:yes gene_type:complete